MDSYFGASGLELSSPFGISSLVSGAFTVESGKISRGILYDGSSKKKEPIIMEDSSYAYLLDWQKLNLTLVLSRGIGAGNGLEAESLILIPDALFLTSFRGFF
jgi:hypothetical protein